MSVKRSNYNSLDPEEKREYIRHYVNSNAFPRMLESGYVSSDELILGRIYNGVKSVAPDSIFMRVYVGDIVGPQDFALVTNRLIRKISDPKQFHSLDRVLYEIWSNYAVSFSIGCKVGERVDENSIIKKVATEQNKLF